MFKLTPNPTFSAQVPLSVPGLPEPLKVAITFRHKTKPALQAWMRDGRGKDDAALLHELIVGWEGMTDADGADVPYSLTALNDLLANYWCASDEITAAYLYELKESKRKNF